MTKLTSPLNANDDMKSARNARGGKLEQMTKTDKVSRASGQRKLDELFVGEKCFVLGYN